MYQDRIERLRFYDGAGFCQSEFNTGPRGIFIWADHPERIEQVKIRDTHFSLESKIEGIVQFDMRPSEKQAFVSEPFEACVCHCPVNLNRIRITYSD